MTAADSTQLVPPALDNVHVTAADGVAEVTLARPDIRNAFSDDEVIRDLIAAFAWVEESALPAMILTGEGTAFSAGGNVKRMLSGEGLFSGSAGDIERAYRQGIQRVTTTLYELDAITIAAVNGPAVGAGFDLSLGCDLRLASTSARFGETFVDLGIISGDGGAWLLPRVVGWQRAAELTYTGRVVDADEALELGVVLSVHEPEELLPAARSLAATIAVKPPLALRLNKRLLRRSREGTLDEVLELAATYQAACHRSDEHRAAVERLAERLGKR
jgi:enoyl-CoA hydratase/carnithine racemase